MKSKITLAIMFLFSFLVGTAHADLKFELAMKTDSLNNNYITVNSNKKVNFFGYKIQDRTLKLGTQDRKNEELFERYVFSIGDKNSSKLETFFILEKTYTRINTKKTAVTDEAIQKAKTFTRIIYLPKDEKLVSFDFKIDSSNKSLPIIKTTKIKSTDTPKYYSFMRVAPETNIWNGKMNVLIIERF